MFNNITLEELYLYLALLANIIWFLYFLDRKCIKVLPKVSLIETMKEINMYIDSFYSTILTAKMFEVSVTNKKNEKLDNIINDMTLEIYLDFTKSEIINRKLQLVFMDNKEEFTLKYIKSRLLIITSLENQGDDV